MNTYRIYSTKKKKYIKETSNKDFDFCSKDKATVFPITVNHHKKIQGYNERYGDELYLIPIGTNDVRTPV